MFKHFLSHNLDFIKECLYESFIICLEPGSRHHELARLCFLLELNHLIKQEKETKRKEEKKSVKETRANKFKGEVKEVVGVFRLLL